MEATVRNENVQIVMTGGRLRVTGKGINVTLMVRAEELCGAISGRPVRASLDIEIDKK